MLPSRRIELIKIIEQSIYKIHPSMLRLKPVGICVTSYEQSEFGPDNPILSHIFWGNTVKDAIAFAKSHLVTDFFFSSTFVGSMEWTNGELLLSHDTGILRLGILTNDNEEDEDVDIELYSKAKRINKDQIKKGISDMILEIAVKK